MTEPAADRLALVTGTSTGIGAAVARQLLDHGWVVVGVARRPAPIGHPRYRHLQADLGDLAALKREIEPGVAPQLMETGWRRIALVNNAAVTGSLRPLAEVPLRDLERAFAVNAIAPIWLMGLVSRALRPGVSLRIANLSSGAAVQGFPGLASYCGSKAALRLAGMALAGEWESPGQGTGPDASIMSYEPGVVDTEMQVYARSRDPVEFPWVGMFQSFHRQGRLVPSEAPAAELVAFLESDRLPFFAERRLGG